MEAGLLAGGAEGCRGVRHLELPQQQRCISEAARCRHYTQSPPHVALRLPQQALLKCTDPSLKLELNASCLAFAFYWRESYD